MQLTQLKRITPETLNLSWGDGHSGPVSLRSLRDNCPCAACQGETVLLRTYTPAEPDKGVPGRYELKGAEPIGNYALKMRWGDGHDQGIYTWEHLRKLCECSDCLGTRTEAFGG
jgi:DUF971 family protein